MAKVQATHSERATELGKPADFIKSLNNELIYKIRKCDRPCPIVEFMSIEAEVNSSNGSGITPLMYAERNSRMEIAKLLIDLGAEVNANDNVVRNALGYAVLRNNLQMV